MKRLAFFIWTWLLLRVGADVNARMKGGATRLHVAACRESPRVVSILLKAGADVNAKDDNGRTPLHGAAGGNTNPEVISLLLEAGAATVLTSYPASD